LRDGDALETLFQSETPETVESESYTVHLVCSMKQPTSPTEVTPTAPVPPPVISAPHTNVPEAAFSMQFTGAPFTANATTAQLPPEQLNQLYSQMNQAYAQYMTTYMQTWQTLAANSLMSGAVPNYQFPMINLMASNVNLNGLANGGQLPVNPFVAPELPNNAPVEQPQEPIVGEAVNNAAQRAAGAPVDLLQRLEMFMKILSVVVAILFTVPVGRAVLIILVVLALKVFDRYRRRGEAARPVEPANPVQDAHRVQQMMDRPVEQPFDAARPANAEQQAEAVAVDEPANAPVINNTTPANPPIPQATSRLRFLWHVITSLFTSLVPNNHEVQFL
jgi:hypothetical protein